MPQVRVVLLGLLAAVLGALSTVCLSRAANQLGVRATAAVSGLYGLGLGLGVALVVDGVPRVTLTAWSWAVLAGGLSLVGNALFLAASRRAPLAVVAPVTASAGGLAAGLAVVTGAAVTAGTLIGALLLTVGVVLVARGTVRAPEGRARLRGVVLACASALALAASYLAIGQAEVGVGATWAYVCLMVLVLLVWTIPTALRGGLSLGHPAVKWVLLAEAAGVGVFTVLGRAVAIDPVLSSLIYSTYALLAGAFSLAVLHERPGRMELTGAAVALAASALLVAVASPVR